jgi:hypothetical protein
MGLHLKVLTDINLHAMLRYCFATSVLTFASLGLAKSSVVKFTQRVGRFPYSRHWSPIVQALIVLWVIFSAFTLTFQCGLPFPWGYKDKSCAIVSAKTLRASTAANMFTDFLIVLYVLPAVWKLDMTVLRRIGLFTLFATRLAYVHCPPGF